MALKFLLKKLEVSAIIQLKYRAKARAPTRHRRKMVMGKSKDTKKETKKAPQKTAKEKKQAKQAKKKGTSI